MYPKLWHIACHCALNAVILYVVHYVCVRESEDKDDELNDG